jgi:hypothetical protein
MSPQRMTVSEVIAALQKADVAPDAPVILVMCMDGEVTVTSMELEVSRIHFIAEEDSSQRVVLPVIKGHTHIDRAKGSLGGYTDVKDDADEALRQWTEEDRP